MNRPESFSELGLNNFWHIAYLSVSLLLSQPLRDAVNYPQFLTSMRLRNSQITSVNRQWCGIWDLLVLEGKKKKWKPITYGVNYNNSYYGMFQMQLAYIAILLVYITPMLYPEVLGCLVNSIWGFCSSKGPANHVFIAVIMGGYNKLMKYTL